MVSPLSDQRTPPLIAIDGPSGVGKSTVARKVANLLGVPYLDTGAMYRCLAHEGLRAGLSHTSRPDQLQILLEELTLELRVKNGRAHLQLNGKDVGAEIRSPEVTEATSRFATIPRVRRWMVERQREFGAEWGGVVEGRDIGTVVFPDTPFKFFLDATKEVRAQRRWFQLREARPDLTIEEVARDQDVRDQRDTERAESPLVRTREHLLVDTGAADADGIARRIVSFVTAEFVTVF